MKKIIILLFLFKSLIKKLLRGEFTYKGKNIFQIFKLSIKSIRKNGLRRTLRRLKEEGGRIYDKSGQNLHFPNGLVSGVDQNEIIHWYKTKGKPVDVVIPSYNDLDVLVPCLESIRATTDPELVKVIVVDDYCQPAHRKKLKELENDQVSVVFRDKNGGFSKAVNSGIDATNKKHDIILLNSDTLAHEGWVDALQYGAYEFGVDTGIVGPKLLYADGRIQSAGAHRNTDSPEWFDHYYRFKDANYGPANIPQYVLATTGACMYVKRELINYIGTLDDKFEFTFEDMDWCLRAWEAGYRTLYFPSATLTHLESATRTKNKVISDKEKQSLDYFWEKWGDWFDKRNVTNDKGQRKIIFVLQSFGLSGGIKNIFELANRLHISGFEVEVWGLDRHNPVWPVEEGLKIRTFKNYERLINALSLEEAIKVATWWETAFPVWLSSVTKGIPVYFISEYETWFYPDDMLAQSAVVACYRKEFRNITISEYNLDEIHAIGLDATIVPCGYDYETNKVIKGTKREDNVLLAVGRTFFQKNFEMTYKGWEALGEERPNMWLFGFQPELAKRDSKIEYFTKPSNEEVNELYNKATIFVQTSRHEGFCLPILEAMAAGCPVICTDSHGNRGFCFDGKNCLMVEQDDVEGVKKAIKKLMNDKKLRDRLAKEALETVKDYRWDAVTNKAKKFFDEVK